MTLIELIGMLERQITYLQMLRSAAQVLGDIDRVSAIDADIAKSQLTLSQLQSIAT